MPKQGIVAFEDAYITITDYPRADEAIVHYNDGTVETIVSGYSAEAMNYEIYNMVEAIKGTQPNRSLFFTTEVIDILDQMQNYGRRKGNQKSVGQNHFGFCSTLKTDTRREQKQPLRLISRS